MPRQRRQLRNTRGRRGIGTAAIGVVAIFMMGCGTQAPTSEPSAGLAGQHSQETPATPGRAALTFPPSQTPIEPGMYRWDGFDPAVSFSVESGWPLGHDNPAFFDLFRGSDFPSVSFARFSGVYTDRTHRVVAVDAQSVGTSLLGRTDLTVTGASAIDLGGLGGRRFDLTTLEARTPLFFGPAGEFQLDPEFTTRYRVLDFPSGGVLIIGVHARTGAFDAGVALGDRLVETLIVEP